MGYTHVEFMPLIQHPFDGSWGYQGTGFFSIDSRYGNPFQLMSLIDRLHQAGIGAIIDFAPVHFAKDKWALAEYDGTRMFEYNNKWRVSPWGSYQFDYKRVTDGMDAYMTRVGDTITFEVPLANTPNPFYITFSHSSNVYSPCVGVEVPDEEGHAGHRAAPYVDGADWTAPVWCASVGTHTINFTAIGENGAVKTITLVVIVS